MRPFLGVASIVARLLIAACVPRSPILLRDEGPADAARDQCVTTPVDVLMDGTVAIGTLAAGELATASPVSGRHTLMLRATGTDTSESQSITTTAGAVGTIAVVRALNSALASAALDDTNSVVPAGATKVRVLHLAPGAGTLQVYRTQPDSAPPTPWQFPFNYQPTPTSLSAPFYQSPVGNWEVRIWQQPADASGCCCVPQFGRHFS